MNKGIALHLRSKKIQNQRADFKMLNLVLDQVEDPGL